MKNEIKVGLFVLIALASILFLTFEIKSFDNLKKEGYPIYAVVNDASGLTKNSRVKFRGIKIGIIDSMQLEPNGVKLKLLINKNVKIPLNSMVSVAQDNMLGGKYLEIIPSNSNKYYSKGAMIKKYIASSSIADVMTNINQAVNKVKILINKLNNTLDENTTKNIQITMANIKDTSVLLKNIMKNADKKLPALLDNANKLVLTYKQTGDIIKRKLPSILNKTDSLMYKLNNISDILKIKLTALSNQYIKLGKNANKILTDNQKGIKQTIYSAKSFFANGSESFDKINKFIGGMQKAQIGVDIHSDYMAKDSYFKTTANIAYMPNPTKYYIIGVTTTKDYSSKYAINSNKNKTFINAEIGKRYYNLLIRGGIIQSTGGVGMDYFMNHDKLKFSSEIYDFNSVNDYRGSNPHLNLSASYFYLKHLEFLVGIDNLINTNARTFFLGVGIKFKDNDLKTLISGGATSFLK